MQAKDPDRLNKLIKKAESAVSSCLVRLEEVVEGRMLAKLLSVIDKDSHTGQT